MSEIIVCIMTVVFIIAMAYMVTYVNGGTEKSFRPPRLPKKPKKPIE